MDWKTFLVLSTKAGDDCKERHIRGRVQRDVIPYQMQDTMMLFLVVLSSSFGLLHAKELLREYTVKSKYIYFLVLFVSAQYFTVLILKQNIPISFITHDICECF